MVSPGHAIVKFTRWVAVGITLLTALSPPLGYYLVSYHYMRGVLDAQSVLAGNAISGVVMANPSMWRFEEIRLSEILERTSKESLAEAIRIFDSRNAVIASNLVNVAQPNIMRSRPIYDAGSIIGYIQLTRSLNPLLREVCFVAIVSCSIAAVIFLLFWLLPVNSLRKAYQALEESENKYRSLYQNMIEGMLLHRLLPNDNGTSTSLRVVDANRACGTVFDRDIGGIVGSDSQVLFREAFGEDREELLQVLADRKPCTFQLSSRGGDRIFTVRAFSPEHELLATFFEDITERRRAEEALLESEFRWKFAIEGPGDGVWDWNLQSGEAVYSRRLKEMLGYAEDDILPGPGEWLDRIHPDDQPQVAGTMKEFLAGKTESYEVEHRMRCKDESYAWILSRGMVVGRNGDGNVLRVIGTFSDITERKEHEKERIKIEKLESLGVLAGGIAHDFNNILTAIMGNISFAEMFLDDNHQALKPLLHAEKASERAANLACQLLTFARGGEPVKKVVALQHLVNEAVSRALHDSNIRGVVNIPDSVHAIEGDEGQLSQAFYHILLNARQAMPQGGTLTVSAQNETLSDNNALLLPSGTYVRIILVDQGDGIREEDLAKIFDPYFSTKTATQGLGLASAYSIIKRHGGHVGVRSDKGEGTSFTLYLPSIGVIYSNYQTSVILHTGDYPVGGSILVMDDEEIIRYLATEMLKNLGYRVTTSENGSEAVAAYKAAMESGTPFFAVIMDLTIPGGMGGKEASQQILAINPNACLIVSSGYSDDPIMAHYRAHGFRGALAKPYKMKDLEQLLKELLPNG